MNTLNMCSLSFLVNKIVLMVNRLDGKNRQMWHSNIYVYKENKNTNLQIICTSQSLYYYSDTVNGGSLYTRSVKRVSTHVIQKIETVVENTRNIVHRTMTPQSLSK